MEPFAIPPDWVTFFYYAGIVAGALIPLSLVFKSVRSWIGGQWRRWRGGRVTHAQLRSSLDALKKDLAQKREEAREAYTEALDEHISMLVEKIDGVKAQINELSDGMREVKAALPRVSLMESMLRLSADRDERVGTVYCDETGYVTFVSRSLAQWLNTSRSDLEGWRWLGFTPSKDRESIRAELILARDEHREVRMSILMGPHGAKAKPYMLTMTPMPENPPAHAWAGYITPIGHEPESDHVA